MCNLCIRLNRIWQQYEMSTKITVNFNTFHSICHEFGHFSFVWESLICSRREKKNYVSLSEAHKKCEEKKKSLSLIRRNVKIDYCRFERFTFWQFYVMWSESIQMNRKNCRWSIKCAVWKLQMDFFPGKFQDVPSYKGDWGCWFQFFCLLIRCTKLVNNVYVTHRLNNSSCADQLNATGWLYRIEMTCNSCHGYGYFIWPCEWRSANVNHIHFNRSNQNNKTLTIFWLIFFLCIQQLRIMSFVSSNYESIFRVDGKPILPPVVIIFDPNRITFPRLFVINADADVFLLLLSCRSPTNVASNCNGTNRWPSAWKIVYVPIANRNHQIQRNWKLLVILVISDEENPMRTVFRP